MTSRNIYYRRLLVALFIMFMACKKDRATYGSVPILQPVIEKLSRSYIQAGEKLTLYGKNLVQTGLQTEVGINGRPAEILVKTGDSIQVLVPRRVSTGQVVVTVSLGEVFKTGIGPDIEIKPTPLIKKFWPAYAYGGDTVALTVENFSIHAAENSISLNGTPLTVAGGNGRDTLLVILPEDARTGLLRYSTFAGAEQQMDTVFPVRQLSYAVSTVGGWVQSDPAFSYTDTLLRGYPQLAGSNYEEIHSHMYLAAMDYIGDASRTYTIFLPADEAYINRGVGYNDFLENVKSRPYAYNGPLVAAVIPGVRLSLNGMQAGDEYNTLYTQELAFPGGSPDVVLKMQVTEAGGYKYVNLLGVYGETMPAVRVLREHRVGNTTIMETDGETGVIYF